jgi:hypothetical protein
MLVYGSAYLQNVNSLTRFSNPASSMDAAKFASAVINVIPFETAVLPITAAKLCPTAAMLKNKNHCFFVSS